MEQKTPLYECHVNSKGKMVPFAGYLLPVQYGTGVIKEHLAVRNAAGLFDVSHMGELLIEGEDALNNIQMLVTNDCKNMYDGQVKYSPMCNEKGGVIDDLLIYRFHKNKFLLVVNASNRHQDFSWIKSHLFGNVKITDISDQVALIAIQGPKSKSVLQKVMKEDEIPSKYYTFAPSVTIADNDCFVSATGYTGELGYEIYCKPEAAVTIWERFLKEGKEEGLIPCGLGSRDTLRLEAGMPLYGHELDEATTPIEAGLSFTVKMNKEDFIGKAALEEKSIIDKIRVGIKITGRGIAREECKVFYNVKEIGVTTSGTHSPYLGYPIAMAYVNKDFQEVGTKVSIEVRNRKVEGKIVALPFYKKHENGGKKL